MNHNNKETNQLLTRGDARATRIKHSELHALLVFICQDDFEPFVCLSGEQQQAILSLARSTSELLGECLNPQ